MTIYSPTGHRKIYEHHFGSIPKDTTGRSYEIHHIDGDHSNNDPTNLKCVTIQEHYDIHYSQGDWAACLLIANRMKVTTKEKSELSTQANTKRVADGSHNFLGKNNPSHDRVAKGIHNFQGESNPAKQKVKSGTYHMQEKNNPSKLRVDDGTHNFLGESNPSHKRVANGTHNWQQPVNENHPTQFKWKCPHCDKEGKGKSMFKRWHGNKCGSLLQMS